MRIIKKKQLTLLTTIALSSTIFLAIPQNSEAATNTYKTASLKEFRLVKPNQTVYIYSQPSVKSNKLDKLPNNSAVIVTGKTSNGFSQTRHAFGYAYVKTTALKKAQTNTKKLKYARNISKNYSYYQFDKNYYNFNRNISAKYHTKYGGNAVVKNFWLFSGTPLTFPTTEYETNSGLYVGNMDYGYLTLELKYPLKKNSTWKADFNQNAKIISTNSTVKTKAGTFKNVVAVKQGSVTNYYAPNKGLIKNIDSKNRGFYLSK